MVLIKIQTVDELNNFNDKTLEIIKAYLRNKYLQRIK